MGIWEDAMRNGIPLGEAARRKKQEEEAKLTKLGGPDHRFDVRGTTAQGTQAQGVQADYGQSDQARGQLQGLADMLGQASRGQGPSGAGMAAQAQRDAALSQASALQAARRGRSAVAGAAMAQNAATMGTQQAAQNEAIGRANEIATARGQLGNVLGTMRGQDIGAAQFQASQGQQANQFNAQLGQQNSQFNAGQLQQASLANQAAQLGISQQELQARLQYEAMRRGSQGPSTTQQLIGIGTSLGAAALLSDVNSKVNVRPSTGNSILSGVQAIADVVLAKRLSDGSKEDELERQRKRNDGLTDEEVKAQRKHDTERDEYLRRKRAEVAAAEEARRTPMPRPYQNELRLPPGATYIPSDEKSKREARSMLGNLKPYSYEYKPDAGMPPGRHVGVMAQDLQRSEEGSRIVERDPETGYLAVDYLKGLPTMMAGLADLNQRIQKIEKRRK